MHRVDLGSSGLTVSRISLGTMTFGQQVSGTEALRILDHSADAGINFYDTANIYNAGEAEEHLGRWLAVAPNRRSSVVIASKVRYPVGADANSAGLSATTIAHQLEASLRRLATDHLDLYYLHAPDPATPLEESLGALDALARAGKIRAIGMSNYAAWQMMDAVHICERNGWLRPTVMQPLYNIIAREIEVEILPFARSHGIGVCAYNPLAAGLLTGKHRYSEPPAIGTRFDLSRIYADRYWHDQHFAAAERLAEGATDLGCSLTALALGWMLNCPRVDVAILGVSSDAQLSANLRDLDSACQLAFAQDVIDHLDLIYRTLRGFPPQIVR